MDTLKTTSENVENVEKAVKNQDNNKENKVKYILIGLILLLVSIGLFLCLYKTTEVPEYNDIVSYDLGVNLEETYFTMSVYKLDYNSYSFSYASYDKEMNPVVNLQGRLNNKSLIELTENLNKLNLNLIADRNDSNGGHEYVIVQSDRVTNGSASQGSDHEQTRVVCYDNIPDELRAQLIEFNQFLEKFVNSKDLLDVNKLMNTQ